MPQSPSNSRRIDRRAALCIAAVLCLPLYGTIPVGTSGGMRVSAVDLIPVLIGFCCLAGRLSIRMTPRAAALGGGLVSVTVLHSLIIYFARDEIIASQLARETVKICYALLLVFACGALFADDGLERIPVPVLFAVNVVFAALALGFQYLKQVGYDPLETIVACYLGLGYLLLLCRLLHEPRVHPLIAVCFVALGLLHLKALRDFQTVAMYVAVGVSLASVVFMHLFSGRGQRVYQFALVGLAVLLAATVVSPVGLYKWCVWNSGSSSRVVMLQAGADSVVGEFPMGIGLGQIPAGFLELMQQRGWSNKMLHNTALTFLMQLGLLGGVWLAGMGLLIYNTFRRMPLGACLGLFALVGASMLLHDAHGIRSILILLGLGTSNWLAVEPAEETTNHRTVSWLRGPHAIRTSPTKFREATR